jgi:hypothetical protein
VEPDWLRLFDRLNWRVDSLGIVERPEELPVPFVEAAGDFDSADDQAARQIRDVVADFRGELGFLVPRVATEQDCLGGSPRKAVVDC